MTDEVEKWARIDWLPVQALYLSTKKSAREVAEELNLNPITVQHKVDKEGWADLRKQLEEAKSRDLTNSILSANYTEREQRLLAYGKIVDRFLNDPTAKATDAGAIAALKQIGAMLGDVTQRTETTVLVYEIANDHFPEAKVIEADTELIEEPEKEEEGPLLLPPGLAKADEDI